MPRKKHNVVGANWCKEMEQLRVAIEVYLGARVRFKQMDFDKKTATVFVGLESEERKVGYALLQGNIIHFHFTSEVPCAAVNVSFNEEGTVAIEHSSIRDSEGRFAALLGWGYAPRDRHLQSLQTIRGDQLI